MAERLDRETAEEIVVRKQCRCRGSLRATAQSQPKKDRKDLFELSSQEAKLVFPVCGKRCFSNIQKFRIKDKIESTVNSGVYNWDKDRTEDKKSSIDILIDWLTTEENASKYFGGTDKNGKTSGLKKDGYHKIIREKILKENGKTKNTM